MTELYDPEEGLYYEKLEVLNSTNLPSSSLPSLFFCEQYGCETPTRFSPLSSPISSAAASASKIVPTRRRNSYTERSRSQSPNPCSYSSLPALTNPNFLPFPTPLIINKNSKPIPTYKKQDYLEYRNPNCFYYSSSLFLKETKPFSSSPSSQENNPPPPPPSFLHFTCIKCGNAWRSTNLDQSKAQTCRGGLKRDGTSTGTICGTRTWSTEALTNQKKRIDENKMKTTKTWLRTSKQSSSFNPFASPALK